MLQVDAARDLPRRVSAGPRTLCGVAAGQDHGRNGTRGSAGGARTAGWRVGRAHWRTRPPPSSQFRTVQGGNVFEVAVPQNWQAVSSTNAMKFVPPERLRRRQRRPDRLHARRRARRRPRDVQRSSRRHARAPREFCEEQPGSASDIRAARHPALAAERPRPVARQYFIPWRLRTHRLLHDLSR